MPKILSPKIYQTIYKSALTRLSQGGLKNYTLNRHLGEPLYRYVGYRNSMPQAEDAGRTMWLPLEKDIWNRWTGINDIGNGGSQGLYFSGEFIDENTPFPELEHYLDKESDPEAMIAYYKYEKGLDPDFTMAKASELRSMHLFTLNEEISGLDLKLMIGDEYNPLVQEIYANAKKSEPEIFGNELTLDALYNSGKDASFCRALGNATLDATDHSFFETSSVRDLKSPNVIIRAEVQRPLEILVPQGRATFFVNSTKRGEGVFTVSDMLYNARFEDPSIDFRGLPSKEKFNEMLLKVSNQIIEKLSDQYTEALRTNAPTDAMEEVGKTIKDIQEQIKRGDVEESIKSIDTVQEQIKLFDSYDLKDYEVNSFKVVDSVMNSLSDITKSIEIANKEIEDPDYNSDVDGEDVDIQDPVEEQIDPVIHSRL